MDLSQLSPDQQDFMNKANTMIDKVNENSEISCDSACQHARKLQELKDQYLRAQTNVADAPNELIDKERDYYVFKEGDYEYNQMMEKRYNKQSDAIIGVLFKKYLNEYEEVETILNSVSQQKKIGSYVSDLATTYTDKNEFLHNEVEDNASSINIFNRESYYYNHYNIFIERLYKWFYYIIVALTVLFIISVLLAKKITIPYYRNLSIIMFIVLFIPIKFIIFYLFK